MLMLRLMNVVSDDRLLKPEYGCLNRAKADRLVVRGNRQIFILMLRRKKAYMSAYK
jgi:hypothetical protein